MISECKAYLAAILQAMNVKAITDPAEAQRLQGQSFAFMMGEDQTLTPDGSRVAMEDAGATRTFRRRRFEAVLPITVTCVDKTEALAEAMAMDLLSRLGTSFKDAAGNSIRIEASGLVPVADQSFVAQRFGFETTISFTGGVYADGTVQLITGSVIPGPEIVR